MNTTRPDLTDAEVDAICDGLTQPTAQAAPGPAYVDLPDNIRVPLDSLSADAGYLIGRLLLGTMSAARVVQIIQERTAAAKAAIRAALPPGEPQPSQAKPLSKAEFKGILESVPDPMSSLGELFDVGRWVVQVVRAVEHHHGISASNGKGERG